LTLETGLFAMEVPAKGATRGHVRFALRSTAPEEVGTVALCGLVASAVLFERLKAQWTQFVLALGDAPRLDVLARWEDDGLDLTWEPVVLEPGRMDDIAGRIRDKAFPVSSSAPPAPVDRQAVKEPSEDAPAGLADHDPSEGDDWRVKQLLRIP